MSVPLRWLDKSSLCQIGSSASPISSTQMTVKVPILKQSAIACGLITPPHGPSQRVNVMLQNEIYGVATLAEKQHENWRTESETNNRVHQALCQTLLACSNTVGSCRVRHDPRNSNDASSVLLIRAPRSKRRWAVVPWGKPRQEANCSLIWLTSTSGFQSLRMGNRLSKGRNFIF